MTKQRTIYAVRIKSRDSVFERLYHVLSDSALNAGGKAINLAKNEYTISNLYVEKTDMICYLDGFISAHGGEAEVGDVEMIQERYCRIFNLLK